ncbi:hypothetical protein NDU88_004706 [Pleurodeles waltl]|uniref:Uncharacterized protein n=1 Tax=Pleurodeles waltl TaxID=8319 RepID=A0AAV7TS45_PLEWA|nr:hypothetical protein NDU88_004706 [Pleurodeles waltl]
MADLVDTFSAWFGGSGPWLWGRADRPESARPQEKEACVRRPRQACRSQAGIVGGDRPSYPQWRNSRPADTVGSRFRGVGGASRCWSGPVRSSACGGP